MEAGRLIATAQEKRHRHRDTAMISMTSQHGLWGRELRALLQDQVDFGEGTSATRSGVNR
jgi:hypothetical protein